MKGLWSTLLVMVLLKTHCYGQNLSMADMFESALTEYYDNDNKQLGYAIVDSLATDCLNSKSQTKICLKCIYYNAFFKKRRGLYNEALETYQHVIKLDTTNYYLLKCLGEISTVYAKQKDYAQARQYAIKAFTSSDVTLKLKYRLTEELAKYCINMQDSTFLRESISWIDTSLYYRELASKSTPLNTIQRASDRGLAYLKLEEYDKAEIIYRDALVLLNECCNQPITKYRILNNLGNINTLKGQDDEAIGMYKKCIAIYEENQINPSQQSLGKAYRNIARSYLQKSELNKALNWTNQAIKNNTSLGHNKENTIDQLWERMKNKALLSSIQYIKYSKNNDLKTLNSSIKNGEEAINLFKQLQWNLTHDDSKVLWSEEMKIHIDRMIDAYMIIGKIDKSIELIEGSKYMTLNEKLYRQISKIEDHERRLKSPFSKFEYKLHLPKNNSTTLSYWQANEAYYRITYKDTLRNLEKLKHKPEIDSLIAEYHNSINTKGKYKENCKRLHNYLIPYAIDKTALTIIPHGLLNTISFGALMDSTNHFLIETNTISYLKSTLISKLSSNNKEKDILVINPNLDNYNSLKKLRGAKSECTYISKKYKSETLSQSLAISTNIIDHFSKPINILHIASHSAVDKVNPLGSYIYLSDSTKLTVSDIYQSNIQSNLIVLSMCESALGQLKTSEGIRGISYAFDLTGNHNQILTMWNVDDNISYPIITSMYDHIFNNESPAIALQEAQRKHLDSSPNILRHPHYWAGYIYQGYDQSLTIKRKSTTWIIFGLLGLCALVLTFGVRYILPK